MNTIKLAFDEIKSEIKRVLVRYGMPEEEAETCAHIHTETAYDGVYSHGTNQVARFVNYVQKGWVNVNAEPSLEREFDALRIYNGNIGLGILNALYCADRAMELTDQYDIDMVGIRSTTHWMRGGTYGLYATRKGYVAIMQTNTESCVPPWGGRECRLGNSPFVVAVPSADGSEPLQLDMTMSQYSYRKLQVARLAGGKLPYPGGFDDEGSLTGEPDTIENFRRVLPVGYWKGSAFSSMLDILEAVLTDGIRTTGINQKGYGSCGGCFQVMIVVNPDKTITDAHMREIVGTAVRYVKSSVPSGEGSNVRVPGQGSARFHEEHDGLGIYMDDDVWREIQSL